MTSPKKLNYVLKDLWRWYLDKILIQILLGLHTFGDRAGVLRRIRHFIKSKSNYYMHNFLDSIKFKIFIKNNQFNN